MMRKRSSIFWGSVLVILAILLFLRTQDLIKDDIWGYFFSLVIILMGVWLIAGALSRRRGIGYKGEKASLPLEGAKRANIVINHAAGSMEIKPGKLSDQLLSGIFTGGITFITTRSADELQVEMRSKPDFWDWMPGEGLNWQFSLNRDIPLGRLHIKSGANKSDLDLSEIRISNLRLETGASSTTVNLPRTGQTHVEVNAGVASVELRVPKEVGARIRVKSGLASHNIDMTRFPRVDSETYQSPDYTKVDNRADILIEAGVGSINIS